MPGRLLPEPARRLRCCRPQRVPFPSGIAWAHSRYCREHRLAKLGRDELAELRGAPLEVAILTPAEADRLRPTGSTALGCWLSHAIGCRCYACRYIDAHLDDDDDEEGANI